ncbi:MAG: hypothetical protein AAF402_15975 [Pseudomonadota bacterium]
MKLIAILLNLLAWIPLLIILPLAPFTFILVDGEGSIPGMSQEYAFHTLMISYPLVAIVCGYIAIRRYRLARYPQSALLAAPGILLFTLLLLIFLKGGIQLL